MMTSVASKASLMLPTLTGQVVGAERLREHPGHGADSPWGPAQQRGAAGLPEQLPAPSARHQHLTLAVAAGERDQAPAAGADQRRDQRALRAQGHPVGGVLHVATDDDVPAVG